MYVYINGRTFNFDKRVLKISCTNVEFISLIQKSVNSLSKRLSLVTLSYETEK